MKNLRKKKVLIITLAAQILIISTNTYASEVKNINSNEDGNSINIVENENNNNYNYNESDDNKDISKVNIDLEIEEKIENIKTLLEELNTKIKNKEKIEEDDFQEILKLISYLEEEEIKESFLNELNILKEENKKLEENPKNNDISTKDAEEITQVKNTVLIPTATSTTANTRVVKTETEFKSAMNNRDIENIIVEGDITLTSGISINHPGRNLTIKSKEKSVPVWDNKTNKLKTESTNSRIRISSSYKSSYILYFVNMNITIDGVDFRGYGSVSSYGVEFSSSNAKIINSKFHEFKHTTPALYIRNSASVEISGSAFYNNHGHRENTTSSKYDVLGGAIRAEGNLNIENSYFENNHSTVNRNANSYGGAIYSRGDLSIKDSYFTKNNVKSGSGGVIYARSDTGKSVNIQNTKFVENKIENFDGSQIGAGILHFENTDVVNLNNNDFLNNSAHQRDLIYIESNRLNLTNNKFKNNHTENSNSLLKLPNEIDSMFIEDNEFLNNTSKNDSIIKILKNYTILKGNTFVGNNANTGVFNVDSDEMILKLINTTSENNSELLFSNKEKTSVEIYDSNFTENKEKIVNLAGKMSNLTIEKSNFIDNKMEINSTINGGLINVKDGEKVSISGTDFSNNNIASNNEILGGLLYLNSNNIVINGGSYKDNKINSSNLTKGGVILLDKLSNSKILNATFENNIIDSKNAVYGGVINSNLSLNLLDNHFNNNKTNGTKNSYGGAVYLQGSGEFSNNNIVGNSANNGAGIYLAEKASLNMVSGNINDNNAIKKATYDGGFTGQGGGVFAENHGELNITGTKLNNNSAYTGGAISILEDKDNQSKSKLESVHITNNKSTEFGGGIDLNNSELLVSGGLFKKNTSKYGAAIATNINKEKGKLIIDNKTLFEENEAKRTGGFLNVHERSYLINNNQCSYNMSYQEDLYKKIFIDRTIRMNGNKADKYRFINGFVDEKCAKYKDVLSENIKLNNQSAGACPFNNYDINMLGYEYYVLYKNPENVDGILSIEVYKGDDLFKLKYPIGTEIDAVRRDGTKVENIKAKLLGWNMKRYNKDGEEELAKTRSFINHAINKNDIVMEGNWEIKVLSEVEDKLVDYEIKYITEDGKILKTIKNQGKIGEVISADYKMFDDYKLFSVKPSNATISLKDSIDNKIVFTYKDLDTTTSDEIRIKDINESLDQLEEKLYNTGELDLDKIESIKARILLIKDKESKDVLNTRVSNIEKVSELIIEIKEDIKKYSGKDISVTEKLVIEKKINKLKDSNIKTILEKSLNEIKVTGETEDERIIREINILLNKLDFDLHDSGLLDIDAIDKINNLLLELQDESKKTELENSLNKLKEKESKIKDLRVRLKNDRDKTILEEEYNNYLNEINEIKASTIKSILLEKLSLIKVEKDIGEDSETILELKREIEELKADMKTLREALENSQSENQKNKDKITELNSSLNELEEEVSKLKEDKTKLNEEIVDLKKELDTIKDLESQIESQTSEIEKLKLKIKELEKQLEDGDIIVDDEKIKELEAKVVTLNEEIKRLTTLDSENKKKLLEKTNELEEKLKEIEILNNKINELKEKLESGWDITDELRELEEEVNRLNLKNENLNNTLNEKIKELDSKNKKIKDLENEIERLKEKLENGDVISEDDIEKLKENLKASKELNKLLEEKVDRLERENRELLNKYIDEVEKNKNSNKDKNTSSTGDSSTSINKDYSDNKTIIDKVDNININYENKDEENQSIVESIQKPIDKKIEDIIYSKAKLNKEDSIRYLNGYEDGTIRPEEYLTREEVAKILYRLLDNNSRELYENSDVSFNDVEKDRWSNKAISTLSKAKIINGYNDGSFKPSEKITRAEVATILGRFNELIPGRQDKFYDIVDHWANKSIVSGVKNGWIKGYEDNSFRPNDNITRAEFATILNRKLNRELPLESKNIYSDLEKDKW